MYLFILTVDVHVIIIKKNVVYAFVICMYMFPQLKLKLKPYDLSYECGLHAQMFFLVYVCLITFPGLLCHLNARVMKHKPT